MQTIQIKWALLISLVILCSHCSSHDAVMEAPGPSKLCLLRVSFLDASGNDLLEGLVQDWDNEDIFRMINPDLYSYEIIYPDLHNDPWYQHQRFVREMGSKVILDEMPPPVVGLYKSESRYFLYFEALSVIRYMDERYPIAEMLTFKLSCPSIFGDDKVHEIVSYWSQDPTYHPEYIELMTKDDPDYFKNRPELTFCHRVVFDGKEYTQINVNDFYYNDLTITLEDRD